MAINGIFLHRPFALLLRYLGELLVELDLEFTVRTISCPAQKLGVFGKHPCQFLNVTRLTIEKR